MTNKQKRKVLLRAAEMIDLTLEYYSCNAIDRAVEEIFPDTPFHFSPSKLRLEYGEFYGISIINSWDFTPVLQKTKQYVPISVAERVMALLFFAEVGCV